MTLILNDIPEELEHWIRTEAEAKGKTPEQLVIDMLRGLLTNPMKKRDLSDLAGTWKEDPEFDRIMREQDQIDPDLWKYLPQLKPM